AAKSAALTTRSSSASRYRPKAVTRPVRRASCPSALSRTVFACSSSAATTSSPRASSTADAMPNAAAAATTAGGGTRSLASGTTTRCASGRKTVSHIHSCRSRGLRERASSDKRALADGLARPDQVPGRVDLVPDVPHQEAARATVVVDVGDRALAVRLVPRLDGREPRVHLAHRLVAEVEHVGVEERHVV